MYSVVPVPLMSPVNFCVTVALVTFGPPGAPAGFSFQSLISNPPFACANSHLHVTDCFWSGRRGSNPLPQPWEGRALPDELLPLDHFALMCSWWVKVTRPGRLRTDGARRRLRYPRRLKLLGSGTFGWRPE